MLRPEKILCRILKKLRCHVGVVGGVPCPAQPRERYIANIGPRPQRAPCTYACPAVKHREMSTATSSNVAPWALWIEHAQREPTSVRMSNVRNPEVVVIEINAHVPCVCLFV